MEDLRSQLHAHLKVIDGLIPFKAFSNKSLQDWMVPFIESVDDDGSVSYLIRGNTRFRASPLASTIIWLSREHLLPDSVLDQMQNELLYLRDKSKENDPSPGCKSKYSDDCEGWSLGEGVSVWSTSMAIIALSDNNEIGLSKAQQYKQSVIWLAKQRNAEQKGWGYQNTDNCSVNVIMTALAVRALALCYTENARKYFMFSPEEAEIMKVAIKKGTDYLINTCVTKSKYVFWTFNDTPSCVATTWSLVAINEVAKIFQKPFSDFIEKRAKKGISFVLSKMPSKSQRWEEEKIVEETGAKYDAQKNYYSFSATLLPDLFSIGLSPYHTKVIRQLRWIIKNPDDWKTKYDKREICSFTYAMLISTITCWVRKVGILNAKLLLQSSSTWQYKTTECILGYPASNRIPLICLEKRKLIHLVLIAILFAVFLLIRGKATYIVQQIVSAILPSKAQLSSIWINIVSTALYTLICYIIVNLPRLIRQLKRK